MDTALRYGVDDHGTRNTMPPLTRDFAGSDAPGKVIIASRWRAFLHWSFFFTGYVMFSDIVGITKLYQMYKIYDTFISFFSEIAFLCFLRI